MSVIKGRINETLKIVIDNENAFNVEQQTWLIQFLSQISKA